jgi:hypothetical protein
MNVRNQRHGRSSSIALSNLLQSLGHAFGTYTHKGVGQTISGLLSKDIVNADQI